MSESHIMEWKQNWHDKYLEWICGFANAQGGTLVIGKNDAGNPVGVTDAERLLEEILGKIRQQLGLVCNVNLLHENALPLIEIYTPPYSVPVSLRGHYFFRSGSIKTELTGTALNEFLLKKTGKTWDDVVEPNATLGDIDENALQHFLRDANRAGRLPDISGLNTQQILQKLRLLEGDKLKRAAIVLFGKDPGYFYRNLFVKIGRFGHSVVDMRFQEVAEGNLIDMLGEVLTQLEHKFLIKPVRFEGITRIEELEYPKDALRELLLNALVHRDYMGSMTQIRVHDDRLCIWNSGLLPLELPIANLTGIHSSYPRNPLIAEVCYKAGYIDNWGRGIGKVMEVCAIAGLAEPLFEENTGGVLVTIFRKRDLVGTQSGPSRDPVGIQSGLSQDQVKVLLACFDDSMGISELLKITGRSNRSKFRNQVLRPLQENGLLAMTVPDKPSSRLQAYQLTKNGRDLFHQLQGEGKP